MAQLGAGVRNFSPRGVGAAHNNCSLIKLSSSLLRCARSRCQSLCNCRTVCKELPRSSGDLSTCSCSRFGASVPHLRAASRATMFLGPLTSLSPEESSIHQPDSEDRANSPAAQSAGCFWAGRCWWHSASQVLRPCRAVTTPSIQLQRCCCAWTAWAWDLSGAEAICRNPSDAAMLPLVGLGSCGSTGPNPLSSPPDRANSLRVFHLCFY